MGERKLNIALINPPFGELYGRMKALYYPTEPLGLMYLAGTLQMDKGLKDKIKIRIFDFQFEKDKKAFFSVLNKVDVVGMSCTTPNSEQIYNLARKIKKLNPKTFLVIGGAHPSTLPKEALEKSVFDVAVTSEGEITFLEITKKLLKGKKSWEMKDVKGIAYKMKNGKANVNERRPLYENVDEFWPAYELVDLRRYAHPVQRYAPVADMFTSRGCPYGCTFCHKYIFGKGWRGRSAKNVADEMEYLVRKKGIKEIHMLDDLFNFDKKRVLEICDEIKRRKLKFAWACTGGVRVDSADEEVYRRIKEAGCYYIALGIESASPEILKSVCKGITTEMQNNAIRLANKVGLEVCAWFIIGYPLDTKETVEKTIRYAQCIDVAIKKFSVMTPTPGSILHDQLAKDGRLKTKDWTMYLAQSEMVYRPYYLSEEEVFAYWKNAYRSTLFSPKYLLRRLGTIKSWLGLKRNIIIGIELFKSFVLRREAQ